MPYDNLLINLKQIKVDALYGKKKHFNAADRKSKYNKYFTCPIIIIEIATGSVLFYIISNDIPDLFKYIAAGAALFAAILSGLQSFLDYPKKVEGHRNVGNRYLALYKESKGIEAAMIDQVLTNDIIFNKLENISKNINEINCDAEPFPANAKDYDKAKKSIEAGDEEYTEKELSI